MLAPSFVNCFKCKISSVRLLLFFYFLSRLSNVLVISALMDIKMRSVDTSRIIEICPGLESCLAAKFDDMLWILMQNAAEKTHVAMEPWYSCLDPNLPGYEPQKEDHDECKEGAGWKSWALPSFLWNSIDEKKKVMLRQRGKDKAEQKKEFLPDHRTSMITDEESEKIILSAFHYVVAL